jgi:outer membrane protein TolC
MSAYKISYRILICTVSALTLSACALEPEPITTTELSARGQSDRVKMFGDQEPIKRPLTMADAIARTVKYNLDRRVKIMEEALALDQTKLDRFDLLPKVVTDAGYSARSDYGATSSHDLVTQQISNPSYSLDPRHTTADLGLSWNILDFGVSWYTAHQNADRSLIASERRRKVLLNLVQEVRGAYWRAVGAEMIRERAVRVLADAARVLEQSRNTRTEQLRMPLDSLRFEKTILENMRQLRLVEAEAIAAKSELAALINVDPAKNFPLAMPTSSAMKIPVWSMQSSRMEELAFTQNPDLREQMYQARISVDETKKALLRALPGISFNVSKQYDSNSLLMNNNWAEAGTRLSWNLLSIVSLPGQMEFADATATLADQRILALRMASLAQVQIATRMFVNAREQFKIADDLFRVDKGIAESILARQEKSTQGDAEVVASETILIGSELRRYTTYAAMQTALSRIYGSIGLEVIPSEVNTADVDDLSRVIAKRLDALDAGKFDPQLLMPRDTDATAQSTHADNQSQPASDHDQTATTHL